MRTYSPELKAQVIAEWLLGTGLGTLAKKHGIPKGTVQRWTTRTQETRTVALPSPNQRQVINDLVYEALGSLIRAVGAHARAAEQNAASGLETEAWPARLRELRDTSLLYGGAVDRGRRNIEDEAQPAELPPGPGGDS